MTIRIDNIQVDQHKLEQLDATGRLLTIQKMNSNSTTLNLSDYERGIYIIRISNGNNQSVSRLIKK